MVGCWEPDGLQRRDESYETGGMDSGGDNLSCPVRHVREMGELLCRKYPSDDAMLFI